MDTIETQFEKYWNEHGLKIHNDSMLSSAFKEVAYKAVSTIFRDQKQAGHSDCLSKTVMKEFLNKFEHMIDPDGNEYSEIEAKDFDSMKLYIEFGVIE